jgi:hypothetical protein
MFSLLEGETGAMSGSVGTNATKIVGALVLSVGLVYFFVLPTVDVLVRPHAASEGPRALIVASTEGGTADYALHTFLRGDVDGEMVVELLVAAVDEQRAATENIRLHVTFFGPEGRAGAVRCQDHDLDSIPWDKLGYGGQRAFQQDAVSTTAGAHPLDSGENPPSSRSFPQWQGDITVVTDTSDDTWAASALQCTLPASWVWVSVPRQTTGLLPQVNLNGLTQGTDHQSKMYGDVSITRRSEWTLSESYPAATLDGYYLTQKLTEYWTGERGSPSRLGYLTQPDLMFVQRYTSEDDARTLTVGGIAVGVVGSLVVSSLARFVDIVAAIRRRRRRPVDDTD